MCAHIELARISSFIVRETYGVAPRHPRAAGSQADIDAALKMLHEWRSQLPEALQNPLDETPFDPACCMLHMHYNHLIVLTTRPFFFAVVKKTATEPLVSELSSSVAHDKHTQSCIEAAQHNLDLARLLQSTNRNWLQSGLHFLFNAAVISLLSCFSSSCEGDGDSVGKIEGPRAAKITFAIHVFEQEAKTGTNYPRECCRVLQDLRIITDRFVLARHEADSQRRSVIRKPESSVSQSATPSSQRST